VGFGLFLAAIGLVLLVWPKPAVGVVKLYRGGSVLNLNAPTHQPTHTHRVETMGRVVGVVLLIGGLVLALAVA